MANFNKILFPIDFSRVSPVIVPWVRMMAEKFGAEIHLLFVARRMEHLSTVYVAQATLESFAAEFVKGSEAKIEEFANTHFKDMPACKTKVIMGDAAEEIIRYVESQKIDLVVMGTHGRKGLDRIMFGSVAERVIKSSPAPVLSINPYRLPKEEGGIGK
ncbi:MAG: universal stress protein [Desulfobacteraceae bacterium]|jgi:nucleotide-binding universal stress UspA family protein|nr:MAG: universal stress protein [Desulfobacteraceae bacterium]